MNSQLTYQFYALPFISPLVTATTRIVSREGIILKYTWSDGDTDSDYAATPITTPLTDSTHDRIQKSHALYADVAPLPGYSHESLAEAHTWLLEHKTEALLYLAKGSRYFQELIYDKTPYYIECQWDKINSFRFSVTPPASVQFALDGLLLQLLLSKQHSHFPDSVSNFSIPVNIIVRNIADVHRAVNQGFDTIKLKVGLDFPTELRNIRDIRQHYPSPSQLKIRLDANGAWKSEQAVKNLTELLPFEIAYIEQPVSEADLLEHGHELRRIGVRIAADESARTMDDIRRLISYEACDFFVLKPALIGQIGTLLQIQALCTAYQKSCVITTVLESRIGRHLTSLLTAIFFNSGVAHGLATGNLLKHDIPTGQDPIHNGKLIIDPTWSPNL